MVPIEVPKTGTDLVPNLGTWRGSKSGYLERYPNFEPNPFLFLVPESVPKFGTNSVPVLGTSERIIFYIYFLFSFLIISVCSVCLWCSKFGCQLCSKFWYIQVSKFGASGGSKIMTARSPNVQSAVQKTGADLVPSFGTERVVGVVGIEGGVVGGGGWDVKVQRNHT